MINGKLHSICTQLLLLTKMNKFIEKIVVPKSFLNSRDCAPAGREITATAMARLEKDMSGLLQDPVLEATEKQ